MSKKQAKPKTAAKPMGKATKSTGNLVDDLRAAIVDSNLSRYEIAKRAEVSESVLSLFVNGKRTITLATAAKIAEVLNVGLTTLRVQRVNS